MSFIADKALARQFPNMSVGHARAFFRELLHWTAGAPPLPKKLLKKLATASAFSAMLASTICLWIAAPTRLSGGEAQRIRLASQIGSGLVGVMYILDEPSIGLHQRDNQRLLGTLTHLRDIGNTVIVVEHDEEAILAADYVVDLGPGAGIHGGQIVAAGTPAEILNNSESLTGQYLSGKPQHRAARDAHPLRRVALDFNTRCQR